VTTWVADGELGISYKPQGTHHNGHAKNCDKVLWLDKKD